MSLNEFCKFGECSMEVQDKISKFVAANKKNSAVLNGLFVTAVQVLISADSQMAPSYGWQDFITEIEAENTDNEKVAAELINTMVEQELVTFDLLTFAITKLNLSTSEKNVSEINKYFKTLRSDLVKEEMKKADSKRNMNFINFANAIEFQMYNGEEYAELDTVSKLACLVGDFLEITKGNYSISDVLMIKTAMLNIDFNPKEKVKLGDIAEVLCNDHNLENKIFGETTLEELENPKEYMLLAYIDKTRALEDKDSYIVSTIRNILGRNGIEASKDEIVKDIANKYMKNDLLLLWDTEVDAFDAVVSVLYEVNHYQSNM